MIGGCRFLVCFVRCVKCGKEDKLVKPEQQQQPFCDRDMAAVNGIKGASEKCDPLSHELSLGVVRCYLGFLEELCNFEDQVLDADVRHRRYRKEGLPILL